MTHFPSVLYVYDAHTHKIQILQ